MRRVFISHPFALDPDGNRRSADKICRDIISKNNDILPISPLHLFSYLDDEKGKRESIVQVCYRLIDICDEVWVYGESEGCRLETSYAKSKGKTIKLFGTILAEHELLSNVK